jgi:hypothetical protein
MKRIRGLALPSIHLDRAWPTVVHPRDPWSGDESLLMTGSFEDYLQHCERQQQSAELDEAAHEVWDLRFEGIYRQVLDGTAELAAIEVAARALGVWGRRTHDRRPLPEAQYSISDELLADISENQLPQVGHLAPDRILGPWADTMLPRWVRVAAAAAMVFSPEVPPGVPAWARAIKRQPRPPTEVRAALRAAAKTPPMLWRITGPGRVTPTLPLGPLQAPDGPVDGLPDAPAVIGRVVRRDGGWHLVCGLPLPALPPAERLTRRLDLELMRIRRRERRLTWEVMLCERPELIYRAACEWLWLTQTESPWR